MPIILLTHKAILLILNPQKTNSSYSQNQQDPRIWSMSKDPKGTQSLSASVVSCGRSDFAGPVGFMRKPSTTKGFIDMLFSLLNHIGYFLPHSMFLPKSTIERNPDGFFLHTIRYVPNSGIILNERSRNKLKFPKGFYHGRL